MKNLPFKHYSLMDLLKGIARSSPQVMGYHYYLGGRKSMTFLAASSISSGVIRTTALMPKARWSACIQHAWPVHPCLGICGGTIPETPMESLPLTMVRL